MIDYKREIIKPVEIGFMDPNVIHEVSIRKKPQVVKGVMIEAFKRHQDKKEIFLPYNFR